MTRNSFNFLFFFQPMIIRKYLLEEIKPLLLLSLSEIAQCINRSISAKKTDKQRPVTATSSVGLIPPQHSVKNLSALKISRAFKLSAQNAEDMCNSLFGAHGIFIDGFLFWGAVACFSSDNFREIDLFIEFLFSHSSHPYKDPLLGIRNFVAEFIIEDLIVSKDDWLAACRKAALEIIRQPDTNEEPKWFDVLQDVFKIQNMEKIPRVLPPIRNSVVRPLTSDNFGFFKVLKFEEISMLQRVWRDCGCQIDQPVENRILISVLKGQAKKGSKITRNFFDRVVALIAALGSEIFVDGPRKFDDLIKFLAPNQKSELFDSPVIYTSQEAEKIPTKAADEIKQIYDICKTKGLRAGLGLTDNDLLPEIDMSSIETFTRDFIPEDFVHRINKLGEWTDLSKRIEKVEDVLPNVESDPKVVILEEIMRKRPKNGSLKLALNQLVFTPRSLVGPFHIK